MQKTERILDMIFLLQSGKKICTKLLATEYEVSVRTIEKDLEFIRNYMQFTIKSVERGCYVYMGGKCIKKILHSDEYSLAFIELLNIVSIIDTKFYKTLIKEHKDLLKVVKNEIGHFYHICTPSMEELQDRKILEPIKHSIKYKLYADIDYFENEIIFYKDSKPLKLILFDGSLYLAILHNNLQINGGFKFLRINFITGFIHKKNGFHDDVKANDFIKNAQTLHSRYDKEAYEVHIKVDKKIANHFRVQKFLPSQQIITDEGDLTVSYQISDEKELLPLIKKWIPYMKVLTCGKLDKKIKEIISRYG